MTVEPFALERAQEGLSPWSAYESTHCLSVLSYFPEEKGKPPQRNVYMMMPLLRCTVQRLLRPLGWSSKGVAPTNIPLPLVKRILRHTLKGIAHLHSRGIVHTDLKWDNVMMDTGLTDQEITQLVEREPSRLHPPETPYGVSAAISQPFPPPTFEE